MGHFLELTIGLLLKSIALMFTSQFGGLNAGEKRKLGGQYAFRNNISSRKVFYRSQNAHELGLEVLLAGNEECLGVWDGGWW